MPNALYGHKRNSNLEVLMACPDGDCKSSFIGYYRASSSTNYYYSDNRISQGRLIGRNFSETILEVSPKFSEIYNQAFTAEQQNLTEICGVGYRKALEFLIKDYSILKHPEQKDKIEKKALIACIKDYVEDSRIKTVSKRAVWLGNDETHYIRKWAEKI